MTKNYIAPSIEVENLQVEQGIAMSTVMLLDYTLFNDIIVTEEDVQW